MDYELMFDAKTIHSLMQFYVKLKTDIEQNKIVIAPEYSTLDDLDGSIECLMEIRRIILLKGEK
jgi:hypothetical protein